MPRFVLPDDGTEPLPAEPVEGAVEDAVLHVAHVDDDDLLHNDYIDESACNYLTEDGDPLPEPVPQTSEFEFDANQQMSYNDLLSRLNYSSYARGGGDDSDEDSPEDMPARKRRLLALERPLPPPPLPSLPPHFLSMSVGLAAPPRVSDASKKSQESAVTESLDETVEMEDDVESEEDEVESEEDASDESLHVRSEKDLHPSVRHLWIRRFDFWSRFDQGIQMDREQSWYSIGNEMFNRWQALRMIGQVPASVPPAALECMSTSSAIAQDLSQSVAAKVLTSRRKSQSLCHLDEFETTAELEDETLLRRAVRAFAPSQPSTPQHCHHHVILDPFGGVGGNVVMAAATHGQRCCYGCQASSSTIIPKSEVAAARRRRMNLPEIHDAPGSATDATKRSDAQMSVFVFGIELDEARCKFAANNAQVYGAQHRVDMICGDSMLLMRGWKTASSVMLAPPWLVLPNLWSISLSFICRSGLGYKAINHFECHHLAPENLVTQFRLAAALTPSIASCLPKQHSQQQLRMLTNVPPYLSWNARKKLRNAVETAESSGPSASPNLDISPTTDSFQYAPSNPTTARLALVEVSNDSSIDCKQESQWMLHYPLETDFYRWTHTNAFQALHPEPFACHRWSMSRIAAKSNGYAEIESNVLSDLKWDAPASEATSDDNGWTHKVKFITAYWGGLL